jgi:hypothetical protein
MKLATRILSLLVLAGLATFYVGCKGSNDPGKSDTDVQIEKLTATWKVANTTDVTLDGAAPALDQKGLTLTISGSPGSKQVSYTATKRPVGPSAWPQGGTFEFDAAAPKTKVKRQDDVVVSYEFTADGKLKMTFTQSGQGYTSNDARIESVAGEWVYVFTKQ